MAKEEVTDAGDKSHEGDASTSSNVVNRSDFDKFRAELMKMLDDEKRASSGKDKKITELQGEVKQFQEATLSKDKLLELRQKEFDEQKAEFEKQQALIRMENEKERRENMINKVVARYSDKFPGLIKFADRIKGNTEEEIEIDIKQFTKMWLDDKGKVDVRKIPGRPQSGSGKQVAVDVDAIRAMGGKDKMKWAAQASDEEFAAVFDELHTTGS